MTQGKGIGFLLVFFFFILFQISGEAQVKKGAEKGEGKGLKTDKGFGFAASHAPIDILSDTVEGNQKQNTITFKGNVVAKQEDTTLYTNTMIIYYDPNTKKLKEIMAIGNVKVVQLERRATGQKATFYQDENKVVLEGDAVVREADNVIRGERVTFYVDEERSFVEGGKGSRVTTTIVPSSKEERKK
ncbi:MAG: lipopolysaccharide transport periplasmic protein LptA [Thermodesulfobacteriota bacterium]|nr:lipopolysaccharide transport periplasmic protein LptA [Thermodesulfobacteriota bacterium]